MTDYDRALKILGPDNMMKLNLSGLTVISRSTLNRLKFEHEEMQIELEEKGAFSDMKIKIVLEPGAKLPHRSTDGAAGWDLFADIKEPLKLYPNQFISIPTGVRVQLPKGYYWDIRVRSGLSSKYGIMLLNGAGIVDEDYRGIVQIPLINTNEYPYAFVPGEKVAQAILQCYEKQEFEIVNQLNETQRGTNGFGSTGRV